VENDSNANPPPKRRGRPPGSKTQRPAGKASAVGKNVGGRPTKLTPALLASIREGLLVGLSPELACERVRISRSTYYEWLKAGEADPQGPFGGFSDTVRGTLAEFAFEVSKEVREAGKKPSRETNVNALVYLLDRRFPRDYPRPTATVEVSGPGGTSLGQRDVRALSDEELEALAKSEGGK
jgi:hypothetical protein